MIFDDLDENDMPQVDPTKLKVTIEPRFLEREILIRVKVSDDVNFNNTVKGLDLLKAAFDEEMQELKDLQQQSNVTP